MKRLFAVLLALYLCMAMCACNNEKPEANTPTNAGTENTATEIATEAPQDTATEQTVPETTIRDVEVPANLKCVCFTGERYMDFKIMDEETSKSLYTRLMQCIPDRNKSNPAYLCEGDSYLLVFYDGANFDGDWSESYTYYATLEVAENCVVAQTLSPYTSNFLNFQLSADLYAFVRDIYQTEESI